MKNFMEININCDLGEKSVHHSTKHDPDLLKIVNSANIACGFHAGDEQTMVNTVCSSPAWKPQAIFAEFTILSKSGSCLVE